jgi:hypothetical protein
VTKGSNILNKNSLIIGIIAMILLVIGTIVEGGSLLQKLLIVIGAPVLGYSAYLNKQKMFLTLQTVATIGAILAFFNNLPILLRYIIMVGSGIIGIGYLIKTNYLKEDSWWPLGGLGLLSIAVGFATDALSYPILFNSLLGFGGILVAIYSAVGFFHLKVKIAIIWFVLNIMFSITPMIIIFSQIIK